MSKAIKIFIFFIVALLVFSKQIISHTLLYGFSKWIDREISVDKFIIDYKKSSIIINGAKIINPDEFYYDNFIESGKVTLSYNFKSLFSDLIIINNLTVENPKFFIEVVRKSSIEISPYKIQEMYNDNIGEVKKIVKTTPSKIWPEKDRDINFLILKVKINGAKAFIKTSLSPTITKINLSNIYFSKVGNGWQMGSYIHHKAALKKIYYSVFAKISDLELKNFLKKLYNL